MSKISFLCSLYLLTLFPSIAQTPAQPNIIVFLVDDMGLMDTSVPFLTDTKGKPKSHPLNSWYKTPNMERLAALGTRFSTFYAQSVCSPSRASLITGQNAARHRTTQWINPDENNRGDFGPKDWNWKGVKNTDTATLPMLLQKQGYETIYIGKAHFGPFGSIGENPKNLGYNVNIGGTAIGHPGSYLGQDNYAQKMKNGSIRQQVPHLEQYHQTNTFLTEALTIEAKKEINKAVANQKPFFLQMAHYAVHTPFTFDPAFKNWYVSEKFGEEAQKFASLVSGMDHSLGQLMDELEKLGIAQNTLILFLGDNGSDAPLGPIHEVASSAPLRGKKGTHYEGGMRIPFIAAWAKPQPNNQWQQKMPIKQAAVQTQMGTIMDIYPTILDLLAIKKPKEYPIDGYSLAPSLTGKPNSSKPEVFLMHFPHDHRSKYFTSYRNGNWKLVYHYFPELNPANTKFELFNLSTDPYEQDNLAQKTPKKLKEIFSLMYQQLESEGALYPTDKNGQEVKPHF
ncbi:MAG: sulfatase-like hydrolase/transferase [Spirosomataceae bacterium]